MKDGDYTHLIDINKKTICVGDTITILDAEDTNLTTGSKFKIGFEDSMLIFLDINDDAVTIWSDGLHEWKSIENIDGADLMIFQEKPEISKVHKIILTKVNFDGTTENKSMVGTIEILLKNVYYVLLEGNAEYLFENNALKVIMNPNTIDKLVENYNKARYNVNIDQYLSMYSCKGEVTENDYNKFIEKYYA